MLRNLHAYTLMLATAIVGLVACSDGDQAWISADHTYAINLPETWTLASPDFPIGFAIACDSVSGTWLRTSVETTSQASTEAGELQRLLGEAASNAPPTIGSSDYAVLEKRSGRIGDYAAAWVVVAFTDVKAGPRVTMAYAVGAPTKTYILHFMLIPRERFAQLRPELERIAASFKLI